MIQLNLGFPQIMTFEAERGDGRLSDIAIDDVVLLDGKCPQDRGLSCSFERGDLCAWHSAAPQRVRWFHDGRWTESDDASRICQALRAHARPTLGGFPKREVPEEFEEELRALGYLE